MVHKVEDNDGSECERRRDEDTTMIEEDLLEWFSAGEPIPSISFFIDLSARKLQAGTELRGSIGGNNPLPLALHPLNFFKIFSCSPLTPPGSASVFHGTVRHYLFC